MILYNWQKLGEALLVHFYTLRLWFSSSWSFTGTSHLPFSSGPYFSHVPLPSLSGWCRWLWLSSAHDNDEDKMKIFRYQVIVCVCVGNRSKESSIDCVPTSVCVYMNEWVSSCGQGSLRCHRSPPHKNNKALSLPTPTISISHLLPPLHLLNKGSGSHAISRVHWHMTKKQITAEHLNEKNAGRVHGGIDWWAADKASVHLINKWRLVWQRKKRKMICCADHFPYIFKPYRMTGSALILNIIIRRHKVRGMQ